LKSNVAMQKMLGYGPEELKKIKMEAGKRNHYSLDKSYVRKEGTKIMVKTTVCNSVGYKNMSEEKPSKHKGWQFRFKSFCNIKSPLICRGLFRSL